MASLAASYIVALQLTDATTMRLVTFGEPRIGDQEFAEAHDKAVGLVLFHPLTENFRFPIPTVSSTPMTWFLIYRCNTGSTTTITRQKSGTTTT